MSVAQRLVWVLGFVLLCSISLFATRAAAADYDLYDDTDYDLNVPSHRQQPQPNPQINAPVNNNHVNDYPTPPVYRPYPQSIPDSTSDPNVMLLPRFGIIRGKLAHKTINNRHISSWLGLRYATVGQGLRRFQPGTPFVHYGNEPYDATREPANCPQFPDLDQITQNEARGINVDDCLTLNIHAPAVSKAGRGPYPVMVFVHGEMLFDGGADEGQPDYFMEHDVVLVSINYRLAPFGFLTTLTDEMPGNVALEDIKMALEWIQQHIRSFNGDPDNVTLFGQAGGATLIHALAISGKAVGLFHKLILQSGTALNPYFIDEDPATTVRTFARIARCPVTGRELESINACFERMSTSELLNIFQRHWDDNELRGLRYAGGFKLTVGDRLGYLPQHPASMVANNNYPLIAGVAKDAGAFIMSRFYSQLQQVRSRNISDYVNVVLKHTAQPRHHALWRNLALNEIFTEEDKRNPTLVGIAQGLLELTNLILYRGPVIESIQYTWRKNPTYLYFFDYRGEFHRFGHLTNPLPFETDATLSDDNIYLFPYPEEVSRLNPLDKEMARTLVSLWKSFAENGIPIASAGVWPNVTNGVGSFLRITNNKGNPFEVDVHFGEGINIPNLYPEYFTTTTTSTTTTTRRPLYPYDNRYPNNYMNPYAQQNRPQYPAYRPPYETVLNSPVPQPEPQQNQPYRNFPRSSYSSNYRNQAPYHDRH